MDPVQQESITTEFVALADELFSRFPDLDLSFCLEDGTSRCRLSAKAVSDESVEVTLGSDQTLVEAIFAVKELARIFDA